MPNRTSNPDRQNTRDAALAAVALQALGLSPPQNWQGNPLATAAAEVINADGVAYLRAGAYLARVLHRAEQLTKLHLDSQPQGSLSQGGEWRMPEVPTASGISAVLADGTNRALVLTRSQSPDTAGPEATNRLTSALTRPPSNEERELLRERQARRRRAVADLDSRRHRGPRPVSLASRTHVVRSAAHSVIGTGSPTSLFDVGITLHPIYG